MLTIMSQQIQRWLTDQHHGLIWMHMQARAHKEGAEECRSHYKTAGSGL